MIKKIGLIFQNYYLTNPLLIHPATGLTDHALILFLLPDVISNTGSSHSNSLIIIILFKQENN